jgi:hypothetical protein
VLGKLVANRLADLSVRLADEVVGGAPRHFDRFYWSRVGSCWLPRSYLIGRRSSRLGRRSYLIGGRSTIVRCPRSYLVRARLREGVTAGRMIVYGGRI